MKKIDIEVITEETIRALIELPKGGIYSIESPSPEMLTKFLGEYSHGSKAYRTQGGEDALFCEAACVLHEYGFVHPRPSAIPKNKIGFIVARYEGVNVDWPVISRLFTSGHIISGEWQESVDSSGSVAHPLGTTGADIKGKEMRPNGRYNAQQALDAATTPCQAHSQLDRGRFITERKGTTKLEAVDGDGGTGRTIG